jgi:archaellum component FlaC
MRTIENEHNRYMIGLGEIGKSIGDFNTYVTTLKNIIGDIMKHLGTTFGTYAITLGFLLVGELWA